MWDSRERHGQHLLRDWHVHHSVGDQNLCTNFGYLRTRSRRLSESTNFSFVSTSKVGGRLRGNGWSEGLLTTIVSKIEAPPSHNGLSQGGHLGLEAVARRRRVHQSQDAE